jgi:acetyltransferase-like isoleucine patch superfamily enzyme/acyl carrier protein
VSRLAQRSWARWVLRNCDRVGARPRVNGQACIDNFGRIEIGDDLVLSAAPVPTHFSTGPRGLLCLGNGVQIGHGSAISAQAEVHLGDGAVLGPFAMVLDSDFHEAGDRSQPGVAQPIRIGCGARLGARVTLLRGALVGAGARVLAGSVVSGEIPPGTVAAGVPAQVLSAPSSLEAPLEELAVAEVVRRTLGLGEVPSPLAGPDDLLGWDSLGTLNVLLALERAFTITLEPEAVLKVETVGDLAALVELARQQAVA